jgi:gamma-glutamylcyclotransferase (GGCT)/AIG2-like uncharacterized protein YtfP
MNKNSLYAFYGSLRTGMYNHEIYRQHLQYLFTENLVGFKLYALERYPIAIKTNLPTDTIKAEIFQITDKETEESIHQLELQAHYHYDEITIRNERVGIYLFAHAKNYPEVAGGDWIEYLNSRKHISY